jgi:hypothetical protein
VDAATGCGIATDAGTDTVVDEVEVAFGFGNAGSSIDGDGGTISLRNAMT